MKQWDVFISHASEDKASVAHPLSHALRRAGVRIWLDAFEIKPGDSIRSKIDNGLVNSRYGVVVASPRFFEKEWASAELDAVMATGHVLPVLHELEPNDLKRISPLLAGKSSLSTDLGVDVVAKRIAERVFAPNAPGTGDAQAFARKLAEVDGDQKLSPEEMRPAVSKALRLRTRDAVKSNVQLGEYVIDFCAGRYQDSSARHEDWTFVLCGGPSASVFDLRGEESTALKALLDEATRIRDWVRDNFSHIRDLLPGLRIDYQTTIVIGRRAQPESGQRVQLAELNDTLLGFRVRTYDWVLDELIRGPDGD